MKAVIYKGPKQLDVANVPDPKLLQQTDAIIRITTSGICGSDLHMYEGHTPVGSSTILGHEPMGIVEEVGNAVNLIRKGDRVVMPFNVPCGYCLNCIRGMSSACLTMNEEKPGAAYGYSGMGPYPGAQAEYLRVPHADYACLKLPGRPQDEMEDDFLLLSDIFPTAYYATELAKVETGKTVAIFGAGPVGLLAAYSCKLKGASEIYVVDKSEKRLELARSMGAIPINFMEGDPVEQIFEIRKSMRGIQESLRPGEEKLMGVMCGIDAVGYQAFDRENPEEYKSNQVLMDLSRIINATGALGLIGVYMEKDPAASDEFLKKGELLLPLGELWSKGITIGMGQTPVKQIHVLLRDLIISKQAKPSFIITNRIDINEVPETYEEFDKRDKIIKSVIKLAA